jgi:nicotinate-nucleotide pyrophosphorylase (carboxylating)
MYDVFQTEKLIELWLTEDIGYCDLTAQLMIAEDAVGTFHMNAREPMHVAGIAVAARVFTKYDHRLDVTCHVKEGDKVSKGTKLLTVTGPARSILTAERPALNIAQRLCGIATETARYNAEIVGTKARLIDTRKTTPGLRMLEKHAVVCGGGLNHRLGLDNGVMLKDNHIVVAGSISQAVANARKLLPVLTKIEVECDRVSQVKEALEAGADVIMLDNMAMEDIKTSVAIVAGKAQIEASGGINIHTIKGIAQTGVDFISTSKITQAAPPVDIGLDE